MRKNMILGLVILVSGIVTWTVYSLIPRLEVSQAKLFSIIVALVLFMAVLNLFSYLFNKDKNDFERKTGTLLRIVEVLLTFILVLATMNQVTILSQQEKILERTSQSTLADLSLVSAQGDRVYNLGIFDSGSEPINLGIINHGKTVAPFVRIVPARGRFLSELSGQSGVWEIENLESLNHSTMQYLIKPNPMFGNLTAGEYNIGFSVYCPYCEKVSEEQNISICVVEEINQVSEVCNSSKLWR
jgi:hypothetical protein